MCVAGLRDAVKKVEMAASGSGEVGDAAQYDELLDRQVEATAWDEWEGACSTICWQLCGLVLRPGVMFCAACDLGHRGRRIRRGCSSNSFLVLPGADASKSRRGTCV